MQIVLVCFQLKQIRCVIDIYNRIITSSFVKNSIRERQFVTIIFVALNTQCIPNNVPDIVSILKSNSEHEYYTYQSIFIQKKSCILFDKLFCVVFFNFSSIAPNREYLNIKFSQTLPESARIKNTSYRMDIRTQSNSNGNTCESYSIPFEVRKHVETLSMYSQPLFLNRLVSREIMGTSNRISNGNVQ